MERGCTGGLSPGWKRPKGKSALRADTGRNNRASIAAHLSAGFRLAPEDPEHPGRVNFIYQTR